MLRYSELDSRRFGYRICRGNLVKPDPELLLREIVAEAADIAIIRTPVGLAREMQPFESLGMHLIHADTLVYHQADLTEYAPRGPRNIRLNFGPVTEADLEGLKQVASLAFAGYVSHYSANPLLDPVKSRAGYVEWASGYLEQTAPNKATWVARNENQVVAFACCLLDDKSGIAEIVLNAVHPDHTGRGIYNDLVRHVMAQCFARGLRKMEISTQIWNYAVQKVWAREGFALARAYDTYHVNALLSAGQPIREREITFRASLASSRSGSPASVDLATGMAHPAPAHMIGSSDAIGLQDLLMQAFGEGLSSPQRLTASSLAPVRSGVRYTARLRSLPTGPRHLTFIGTVHDQDGGLCLLCYGNRPEQEFV